MVKIADRLYARQLHFHGDAALAFSLGHQPSGFPDHAVSRPDSPLHMGNVQRFEDFLHAVAVGDADVIRRRGIVVGAALAPVAFRRKNELARGFFPVQATAGTEHDEFLRTGYPTSFVTKRTGQRRAEVGQVKADVFALVAELVNGLAAVATV